MRTLRKAVLAVMIMMMVGSRCIMPRATQDSKSRKIFRRNEGNCFAAF